MPRALLHSYSDGIAAYLQHVLVIRLRRPKARRWKRLVIPVQHSRCPQCLYQTVSCEVYAIYRAFQRTIIGKVTSSCSFIVYFWVGCLGPREENSKRFTPKLCYPDSIRPPPASQRTALLTSFAAQHCSMSHCISSQSHSLARLQSLYGKLTLCTQFMNASTRSSPPYRMIMRESLMTIPSSMQDIEVDDAPMSITQAEGKPAEKVAHRPSYKVGPH